MRHVRGWCGALLLMAGGAVPAASLQVLDGERQVLLTLDLTHESCWVVRWNHSVTGNQIDDYYCLRAGDMTLTATHTPAFDAGLGHITGRGRLESDHNHGYWIRDIDEPVPGNAYWLRVGSPAVDHRLLHAGRSHSLSALAAGSRVQLRIVEENDHAVR